MINYEMYEKQFVQIKISYLKYKNNRPIFSIKKINTPLPSVAVILLHLAQAALCRHELKLPTSLWHLLGEFAHSSMQNSFNSAMSELGFD